MERDGLGEGDRLGDRDRLGREMSLVRGMLRDGEGLDGLGRQMGLGRETG